VALTGAVIVAMDWVPTPLNRNIAHTPPAERIPGTLVHGVACVLACLALARGPRWAQHTLIHALVLASAALSARVAYRHRPAPTVPSCRAV
jgi:hypothetical protein